MKTTSPDNHKNGRPTRTGQLHIQTILRPFFEQGLSASVTAEKTRINIKTAGSIKQVQGKIKRS